MERVASDDIFILVLIELEVVWFSLLFPQHIFEKICKVKELKKETSSFFGKRSDLRPRHFRFQIIVMHSSKICGAISAIRKSAQW